MGKTPATRPSSKGMPAYYPRWSKAGVENSQREVHPRRTFHLELSTCIVGVEKRRRAATRVRGQFCFLTSHPMESLPGTCLAQYRVALKLLGSSESLFTRLSKRLWGVEEYTQPGGYDGHCQHPLESAWCHANGPESHTRRPYLHGNDI